MPLRIEGGDDRQEDLRRADVGGGLLPADVLLAGLEREAMGRTAMGVDRHPDESSRKHAAERLAGGEEAGARSAVAERDTESLC